MCHRLSVSIVRGKVPTVIRMHERGIALTTSRLGRREPAYEQHLFFRPACILGVTRLAVRDTNDGDGHTVEPELGSHSVRRLVGPVCVELAKRPLQPGRPAPEDAFRRSNGRQC